MRNEYEKIILENFLEIIKTHFIINDNEDIYQNKNIIFNEEINSLNVILSFIKKLALSEEEEEEREEKIKLINRTKFNILKNCYIVIFNYLIKLINKKFIYDLNYLNTKEKKNICNDVLFKDLFNVKNNVYKLYINKLEEIKYYLENNNFNNIKGKTKEQITELINNYIDSNSNLFIKTCKEIILFFIKQKCFYENKNEKIIEILFKNQKIYELQSFQNYCEK